jgi:hypothetical protein
MVQLDERLNVSLYGMVSGLTAEKGGTGFNRRERRERKKNRLRTDLRRLAAGAKVADAGKIAKRAESLGRRLIGFRKGRLRPTVERKECSRPGQNSRVEEACASHVCERAGSEPLWEETESLKR